VLVGLCRFAAALGEGAALQSPEKARLGFSLDFFSPLERTNRKLTDWIDEPWTRGRKGNANDSVMRPKRDMRPQKTALRSPFQVPRTGDCCRTIVNFPRGIFP